MGTVAIKAACIWPGCPEDLVLTFLGEDLEDYRPMDMSNVSQWAELRDMDHAWSKGGKDIGEDQARDLGAGKLVAR